MNMKPVPTIIDPKKAVNKKSEINNVTSPVCIPRRTEHRGKDQYELFISKVSVKDFRCSSR